MTETAITSKLAGAVYLACTKIPAINREYTFVGAFHHWFYIGSTKVDESDAAVAINASMPSPCCEDKQRRKQRHPQIESVRFADWGHRSSWNGVKHFADRNRSYEA
jgi:hypothetical protein